MTLNSLLKLIVPLLIVAALVFGAYFLITNKGGKESNQTKVIVPDAIKVVTLTSSGFSPSTMTIKKSEAIKWLNQTDEVASINSDPHPTHEKSPFLNLGELVHGSAVQTSFYNTGTFTYHNHYNPAQKGTVIVE